ncbi:catalase [Acidisoma sp.]|uniref:catalase n=1 Tax=Acidisoma sp. TaxID=1872115 RepID=UPI003AFF942F
MTVSRRDKASHAAAAATAPAEVHQVAGGSHPDLTTNSGVVIADAQNSLTAGARGPALLEDFVLREKIMHFDHERIPERVVHARGYAAHGYFEVTNPLADHSRADLFQRAGSRVPVFARFSTVAGNKGSGDLARDVRGFAVKFYTEEGNWDLVGNNIPVFFIQDAIKFPDLIHSVKQEPDRGFPQAQSAHDTFYDFISLTPEAMHMMMWVMSDRGIPRSMRMMEGFGVHTYRLVNASGQSTFVKFHWRPKIGSRSVIWDEALKINGADPDFHRRDLWNAIESGDFPEWELSVQMFDQDFADKFPFDILDATKLIPEELVPLRPVGRMVLDQNVKNFFAETEQVAFCTANIVPGIDFSDDPLLQGRNFSYFDTQLTRLGGPNFNQIPINQPRCPMANFQRDGHMQMQVPAGRVNYEPNSLGVNTPRENPKTGYHSFPQPVEGPKVRHRSETFADHFSQARQFFDSQTKPEQDHIVAALVFELSKVETVEIRQAMLAQLANIRQDLSDRIARGLEMESVSPAAAARPTRTDLPVSPALSLLAKAPKSLDGCRVGILIDEGSDISLVEALQTAIQKNGGQLALVAPRVGTATAALSGLPPANYYQLAGGSSVLFDAVAVIVTPDAAQRLSKQPAALQWVMDAYSHLKVIGHTPGALPLLQAAGVGQDQGVVGLEPAAASGFAEIAATGRIWAREPLLRPVP